ncbi:MAG: universal stress protein [gamma proteobacterium symbiont of Bathyaustriella thionipta]|nr:universal stress protein [gamma proteobacterium symbiont of Bathyaustriella thionipta]
MAKQQSKPRILVPVDFYPASEAALLKACEWAECQDADIIVLHVIHDSGDMPGYFSAVLKKKHLLRIEDVAREMCDQFIHKIAKAHPQLDLLQNLQCILVKGIPVTRILQAARKLDATAIVMGSKGMTGLRHMMLGSVAERVVQLCPLPVTVIKVADDPAKK